MSDVQFTDAWQGGHRLDVVVIERMPSVESHSRVLNLMSRIRDLLQERYNF